MQGRSLVAVFVAAFGLAVPVALPAFAEDQAAGAQEASAPLAQQNTAEASPVEPDLSQPAADPALSQPLVTEPPPPPAHPVVASIREKLSDSESYKGVAPDDLAGLEAFYGERSDPPVWVTDMGFTYQGQAVISEIGQAEDWGLSSSAFDLPDASRLPATTEDQAAAELKLALAVLQYARHARGGRVTPSALSKLIDQVPPLRNPKTVLLEISATNSPDEYLRSQHPKHQQFQRLRQALLKARKEAEIEAKQPSKREIQRLLINMERWRWMPESLGEIYVESNLPEFMLHVVKNGTVVHSDKLVIGKLRYATPVFTADLRTIVFNPEWTVPPTIVREDLLPKLRRGSTAVLRQHQLTVRVNGRTVNPRSIPWRSVKFGDVSFHQAPGPKNVLGKVKFLYPNKHIVYMHDTIKKGLFDKAVRIEGHNCPRMQNPSRLAEVLLAEDKGWSEEQVEKLFRDGNNSAVSLDRPIPVHTTYFTARVDEEGKVRTFNDPYGLDTRTAKALFSDAAAIEVVAENAPAQAREERRRRREPVRRSAPSGGVAQHSIPGLFGN